MKLLLAATVMTLVVESSAQWYNFPGQAVQGAGDMWRAYRDLKKANWINSDKYFHARGNYDAAQRGPGGKWAAEVISDARERTQEIIGHLLPCTKTGFANSLKSELIGNAAEWMHEKMGHHASDSEADQFANRWGREGKDPNHFRPEGLPEEY